MLYSKHIFAAIFCVANLLSICSQAKEVSLQTEAYVFPASPSTKTMDYILGEPKALIENFEPALPKMVSLVSFESVGDEIEVNMKAMKLFRIQLSGQFESLKLATSLDCDIRYDIRLNLRGDNKQREVVYKNAKSLTAAFCYKETTKKLLVKGSYVEGNNPSVGPLYEAAINVLRMQLSALIEALKKSLSQHST